MMLKKGFLKSYFSCCLCLTFLALAMSDVVGKAEGSMVAGGQQYALDSYRTPQKAIARRSMKKPAKDAEWIPENFNWWVEHRRSRAKLKKLIRTSTKSESDYYKCGLGHDRLYPRKQRKIIGGKLAPEHWPWMAAIFYLPDDDPRSAKHTCGGSIIDTYFILTAAHCMFYSDGSVMAEDDLIVKLGVKNVKNKEKVQDYYVERIILPPDYDKMTLDYDIALLQLTKPIKFTANVRPICLPPEPSSDSVLYRACKSAVAIGWGHTDVKPKGVEGFSIEDDLKEVMVPIQSRKKCLKRVLINGYDRTQFTDRMFCAGYRKQTKDTCPGDSGGPLMQAQRNEDGKAFWTLIGVTSWGNGCTRHGTYGYYTHVQNLKPWLLYVMQKQKRKMLEM